MEAIVKNNQSLIDVAIEHLGSAELALDIALLNGISLTDVLVPGTSLLLPDVKPQANTEALPVVATVTEASLLQLLTAHSAIMGGAVAGHVRNGGNIKFDSQGRGWVELSDLNFDWDHISEKPLLFPPSAHNQDWSTIDNKPTAFPPSSHNQDWTTIDNKPTAFPPSSHNHIWAEIIDPPAFDTSKWEQLENETITDFFMPSLDELKLIRNVTYEYGISLNILDSVWSSSEKDINNAYYLDFNTNISGFTNKAAFLKCFIKCRKIPSTSIHAIGSYTLDGGYVFFIEQNTGYKTYWTAYQYPIFSSQGNPWAISSPVLIGSTSQAFGEGINNTNEIIALDPNNMTAASYIRFANTTIDNSLFVKPIGGKFTKTDYVKEGGNRYFTENRVMQTPLISVTPPAVASNITATDRLFDAFGKISKWFDYFLPKDTTLQAPGTPNQNDLFSFHDIINNVRKKIRWIDLVSLLDNIFSVKVYNVFKKAKNEDIEIDPETIVYNDHPFETGDFLNIYLSSEDRTTHTFSELQLLTGESAPNVGDILFFGDIVWLGGPIPGYKLQSRYIFRFVCVRAGEIQATWKEYSI